MSWELPCACTLLKAGNEIFVYNRTKEKADGLVAKGATWCDSPAEVSRSSDVIFTIVGYPSDVEETILGSDGVLANADSGKIIVDMTTSEPAWPNVLLRRRHPRV